MLRVTAYLMKNWLELLTGAILGAALVTWVYAGQQGAALTGDFVSGFSSALAFLWLIAGFRNQTKELATQREELKLQRSALEAQTVEMKNAARFASLGQIATLVDRANVAVEQSGLPNVKKPADLSSATTSNVLLFKVLSETRDVQVYLETYAEYSKVDIVMKAYLSGMAAALKLHMDVVGQTYDKTKDDDEFLWVYSGSIKGVPYLGQHEGTVFLVAQMSWLHRRMRKSAMFGSMAAIQKMAGPEALMEGAFEKVRAEMEKEGIPIPAIAQ